jgi:CHAT domain-containing protein
LPDQARLLIAPCNPLYLVPFAALRPADHYLVERHTIQLIPCGALLAVAPDQAPTTTSLVIAASAGGRLAAVHEEAAAVQRSLPAAARLVDEPRSLAYLQGLEAAPEILHIAAHSILREDAPIFSALQLAGEMLSVEQCYDLPLRGTRLVTLSGCTTATGLDTGGSLLAFQSALFAAGAHAVISSLWLIDDRSTVEWMTRFYQELAGCDPPTAVRRTQQALLVTGSYRHPALWAAFVCSSR